MTICSWRMQSPERPLNFVRPHAKLRNSKAKIRDHECSSESAFSALPTPKICEVDTPR